MLEDATMEEEGRILSIHIPLKLKRRGGRKEIIPPPGMRQDTPPTALQSAIARAYRWQRMLDTGEVCTIADLAARVGTDKAYVGKTLRLTLLAPEIVEAILADDAADGISLTKLFRGFPIRWDEQREIFMAAG